MAPVIVKAADAPKWLSPFMERLGGKMLLRANYTESASGAAAKELFVDVQDLFENSPLQPELVERRFSRIVGHCIPHKCKRLVYLDDPGSRAMAEAIRARIGEDVALVSVNELNADLSSNKTNDGGTVVVAGAVCSGRSLLAVSQALRFAQPNGIVNYVIGVARTPNQDALREIRSNATYGDHPDEHGFFVMEQAFVPITRPGNVTVWDEEAELLKKLLEEEPEGAASKELEFRLQVLNRSSSNEQRGLVDNLFWLTRAGHPLELRTGFTFFNFVYAAGTISQADVYFSVAAVLHGLRLDGASERSLRRHERRRRVISPRCFDRFNDGVVQAAYLRAALPSELDYSTSPDVSDEMAQVLEFILGHDEDSAGEASREFLFALALRRLRLTNRALARLVEKHGSESGDAVATALWKEIEQSI